MGRINSSVGLISGLQTEEIIKQLLAFEARPLVLLESRKAENTARQSALTGISAQLLAMQLSASSFSQSSVLNARTATSSNSALVKATASATAAVGSYQFRAVRQAQTQRYSSAGFANADAAAVGAGTITIKQGGFLAVDTSLGQLNGGDGVARGSIRITDRSGSAAVVDLSSALTIGDVTQSINQAGLSVVASASGDRLVLTDVSGQTTTSLRVQEVGTGGTAASLGILGAAAGNALTGSDIVRLSESLKLGTLQDGNGVRRQLGQNDLLISLTDSTTLALDLGSASTLGDVLAAINNHGDNGGKLTAAIAPDGDRLQLTDHTGTGGLSVAALNGSKAARDLGILGTEQAGGVLTGRRVLAGLQSVLVDTLDGGSDLSAGQVTLTDRANNSATINLQSAESLADVIDAINGAGVGITAALNAAGNGILLTDTTGASAVNLQVSDLSGNLADRLNIAGSVAASTINSGDVNLRYISENTLLESLNGGAGVPEGKIHITDSAGGSAIVDLSGPSVSNLGDVLLAINATAIGVAAEINSTGDGIVLVDTAGGNGSLTVSEVDGGGTAAALRLLGSDSAEIDGAFRYEITVDADDTLNDVVEALNASGAPLGASLINDGGGSTPYRLLLTSQRPGAAGRLLIDSGDTGLGLSVLAEGVDAVLELGGAGSQPLVFVSQDDTFADVLPGLTVEIAGVSSQAVTVTVANNAQPLRDALGQFVTSFNAVAKSLADHTRFDAETEERGILQGDSTANLLQRRLLAFVGQTFGSHASGPRRLSDLGISLTGGQLSFSAEKFDAAVAADSTAVKSLLDTADTGFAAVAKDMLEGFTDAIDGTVIQRMATISEQTEKLDERITRLEQYLETRQQRLTKQFLALEKVLAQLQTQEQALQNLVVLPSIMAQSSSK